MAKVYFDEHKFDIAKAQRELGEFKTLLDTNTALRERAQVLAGFKRWPNLCALFGKFHGQIGIADLIKREFGIARLLRTDLTVSLKGSTNFCLVEFEGAGNNDIFKGGNNKTVSEWARPFEKGFSQVVDWAWALDTGKYDPTFKDAFGTSRPNCLGILVIGRSTSLTNSSARDRWDWRSQKVGVDGIKVTLLTFDDLYFQLDTEIKSRL